MVYVFHKKIEKIIFRIKAIQKSYDKINNVNLKIRLLKEYEGLKCNFFKLKSLVKLIEQSTSDKLSISKLLDEKCIRCEYEIFKNNYLFFA
tara:strand:- start:203 stop:475 length:273 start_codon:yes stop_codon:yes gene_type:complete